MSEDLFENTNIKVYENDKMLLKEETIKKFNALENRIKQIVDLKEENISHEETLLLYKNVRTIYIELLHIKENIEKLKN